MTSEQVGAALVGTLDIEKVGTGAGAHRGWETRRGRAAVKPELVGRRRGKEELPTGVRAPTAIEEKPAKRGVALDWLAPERETAEKPEAKPAKVSLGWLSPAEEPAAEEPAAEPAAAPPAGLTPEQARQWADETRFTGRTRVERAEKKKAKLELMRRAPAMQKGGPPLGLQAAWSAAATATSNAIGAKAVQDTLDKKREHAWFVDAETGETVGRYLEGNKGSVEMTMAMLDLKPDRAYISGHTHPGPAGPSPEDLVFFMVYPQITRMVIHDIEGNVYEIEKPADWEGKRKGVRAMMGVGATYRQMLESHAMALQLDYMGRGGHRGKNEKEIRRDLMLLGGETVHAAMTAVAKGVGLTYRRRKAE